MQAVRAMRGWLWAGVATMGVVGLAGCGHEKPRAAAAPPPPTISRPPVTARKPDVPVVPAPPPAVVEIPRGGKPFSTEVGMASWYGTSGRKAANGEFFDQNALTAASRTLPLGTIAKVTNLVNGQSVVVRINDRGPFVPGRIMDLSMGAAKATGVYRMGLAKVRIEAYATQGVVMGEGHWCVQIGAFLDPDDATVMKNELIRRYGATAKVITFKGDTGSWVRLTPLVPDKDKAEEAAAQVHVPDPGVEAYVTRTN